MCNIALVKLKHKHDKNTYSIFYNNNINNNNNNLYNLLSLLLLLLVVGFSSCSGGSI